MSPSAAFDRADMDDTTTNYGNDDCDVYSDGEEGDLIVDVDGEEEVRSGGNSEGEDVTAPIHGEDSDDQVVIVLQL